MFGASGCNKTTDLTYTYLWLSLAEHHWIGGGIGRGIVGCIVDDIVVGFGRGIDGGIVCGIVWDMAGGGGGMLTPPLAALNSSNTSE